VLNGELLTVLNKSAQRLSVYDVNQNGQQLNLKLLSDIRTVSIPTLEQITAHDDLLEWRMNNRYYNTRLPFNNLWKIQPEQIGSGTDMLSSRVAGASSNWKDVLLEVVEEVSASSMNGSTLLVGDQLQYQVYGNSYQAGSDYRINLFNQPHNNIDGALVDIDLPWMISAEPLFGLSPLRTLSVIPGNAITGRTTEYKVIGQQLHNADEVELGDVVLSPGEYAVNAAGTEMNFSVTFATPGLKTLRVSQENGTQVASIPAAVLVAQAIEIGSITTNNAKGGDKALSDSGNNKITVQGLGLEGNLAVHLIPYDQGFLPDATNLVRHRLQAGQLIIDSSPKAVPGRSRVTDRSVSWMAASVAVSTADVASSSTSTLGSDSNARASATRCRCPPDSVSPRSPTTVS
jgi:hypothetical protein